MKNLFSSFLIIPSLLVFASLYSAEIEGNEPEGSYYKNRIQERGTLIVGMQRDYHPFHVSDAREGYPGIDVELTRAIADSLDVSFEIRYLSIEELLSAVESGEIDMAFGGLTGTVERSRQVNFTSPYLKTTPAALLSRNALPPESRSDDTPRRNYSTLADLRYAGSLRLGVLSATTNADLLKNDNEFRRHQVRLYESRVELLEALKSGGIDALIADGVYIQALVLAQRELLNRFEALTSVYREEHLSIAIPPGDPEYWLYLNFLLDNFERNGLLPSIIGRYFQSADWVPQ